MVFFHKGLARLIAYTEIIFDLVETKPELKAAVATRGFNDDQFSTGFNKFGLAKNSYHLFIEKQKERNSQYIDVDRRREEIRREYLSFIKQLDRLFHDDPETRDLLGTRGRKKRKGRPFLEELSAFYNTCINNAEVAAKILEVGLTQEIMQAAFARLEAYKDSYKKYVQLKGECQKIVDERDAYFKDLLNWVLAFESAARFVYRDNPQALEEIGIFVPNTSRSRRSEEPPSDEEPAATTEPPAAPPAEPPPPTEPPTTT